jgi:hypothetical protein
MSEFFTLARHRLIITLMIAIACAVGALAGENDNRMLIMAQAVGAQDGP